MNALGVQNLSKSHGRLTVLPPVSFQLESGSALGLFGPTGCGKTTLLRIIAGLDSPTSGTMTIGGSDANGLPLSARRVGMVFQDLALWPHLSAARHLDYVLRSTVLDRSARKVRTQEWLERLGLVTLADARPSTMSRGQRQRLAVARALCGNPALLLLDEPISSQDAASANELLALFEQQRSDGKAIVAASHDKSFLAALCEHVLVFEDGGVRCVERSDFV